MTSLDTEDKAAQILAEQAEAQAEHERNMEDPAFRYVAINAGELALIIPVTDEEACAGLDALQRGEYVSFLSTDGRYIGFPPGKIDCVSRLTYKHRFTDEQNAKRFQQQQQLAAAARNGTNALTLRK